MPLPALRILPRPKLTINGDIDNNSFLIYSVGANVFRLLARKSSKKNIEIFIISIVDLDRELAFHKDTALDEITLLTAKIEEVK